MLYLPFFKLRLSAFCYFYECCFFLSKYAEFSVTASIKYYYRAGDVNQVMGNLQQESI